MKTIATLLTIILSVGCLFGCATLVSKSEYSVAINSTPEGANITVVDRSGFTIFSGKTPTIVRLKAEDNFFKRAIYEVTFEKDGYTKQIARIEGRVDRWWIGNMCIGGPIGLVIDSLSGAMWKLDENVHATLSTPATSSADEDGLYIISLDDVPTDLHQHLVRIN